MNIIGCRVIHKSIKNSFGTGTIHEVTDKAVSVCFPDKTGAQKIIKFTFPDAFKNGHLIAANAQADKAIREAIQALKCSVCALENVRTEKIDGNRYCEACKAKFTFTCSSCGDSHEISTMVHAWTGSRYQRRAFCKTCVPQKSFVCRHCNSRYVNEMRSPFSKDGIELCDDCFDEVKRVCSFCKRAFNIDDGAWFDSCDYDVYVCPDCLETRTFICKNCEGRRLNATLVDSKYVPADRQICDRCVTNCAICGIAVDEESVQAAFENDYCPDCWETNRKECLRCGHMFASSNAEIRYCPDCIDMRQYVDRLKKENFVDRAYRTMNYYSLENIDRCDLFTDLYDFCQIMAGRQIYRRNPGKPFQLLVMDIMGYKVVITYVQPDLRGKAKNSLSITMTDFRKRSGRNKVQNAIRDWLDGGNTYIETAAGKVKILDYPVRLRVQTRHDKIYGKEWNGPGDYIEVGNYGDTTDFYIVGVLGET